MIFVIGNGESRKGVDLSSLKGTTIGCNAIYRDFRTDVLVAIDDEMIAEINAAKPITRFIWCCRDRWNPGIFRAIEKNSEIATGFGFNLDSGLFAMWVAIHIFKAPEVTMVGFDFDPDFKNVYAGTPHYDTPDPAGGFKKKFNTWGRLMHMYSFMADHENVKFKKLEKE